MRFTRRHALIALAVPALAATSALTACAPGGGGGDAGDAGTKDTLILGMTQDIPGLSPLLQPTYQGWFADAAWDAPLICDELAQPSAGLAEEWSFSEDLTSVDLTLREGITFSDGSALDSDDVIASLEAAGTANQRFADAVGTAADEQHVTITWPYPVPAMAPRICELNIISEEAIEADNLDNTVVSSGPYTYDADGSTVGSVYKLTKNPDHWDADTYPYENLELRVFESGTAALNALRTGQIDGTLVEASTVEEAEGAGSEIVTMRGNTTRLLITDHKGEKIPALGDVRVRQAMNMVFDRDAVAEQLYRGYADPAYQIFRPGTDAYIDGLEDPYPYDVEKAKALMAEAGYADGFTLTIPFLPLSANLDILFPYVTEQLAKINITVEQENLTGPDAISELLSGEYPVPLWQLGNFGDSNLDIQDYVLPEGIWNVSHQEDETVAELWEIATTGSEEERVQAQKDINQYIIDQAWFVPMAYPDGFYAHNPEVTIDHISDFSQLNPTLRDFQ